MNIETTESQYTLLNTTIEDVPYSAPYELGAGIDALTGQIRASAMSPLTLPETQSYITLTDKTLIKDQRDLDSFVSFSMKASYNLNGVKLSGSVSFMDKIAISELSVTLIFFRCTTGMEYAIAPNASLKVQPDPNFRKYYGDYFVAGYLGGSQIYVMYQCNFRSSTQTTQFSATIGAESPNVFSVEGSVAFEKTLKESSGTVRILTSIEGHTGIEPTPPKGEWDPNSIATVLIPWYDSAKKMNRLKCFLKHYSLVDPKVSSEINVDPLSFAKISLLFNRFWLITSQFKSCPDFGKSSLEKNYSAFKIELEAKQAVLPLKPEYTEELLSQADALLKELQGIYNRQIFYTRVIEAAKNEPVKNENINADYGTTSWLYGFKNIAANINGIEITSQSDTEKRENNSGSGRIEHIFTFPDLNRVIVGWELSSPRIGYVGDWQKRSDKVLGTSHGEVWVRADWSQSIDWTIIWYTVSAYQYPLGNWSLEMMNTKNFIGIETLDTEAAENYWTPQRFKDATPIDDDPGLIENFRYLEVLLKDAAGDIVSDEKSTIKGSNNSTFEYGPNTGLVKNPREYPTRTIGKLFFQRNGNPFYGSAVVINKVGIMTAAHCLTMNGVDSTNLSFVPAYQEGIQPFMTWNVASYNYPAAWKQYQQIGMDIGFCKLEINKTGHSIGDIVGYCGITLNKSDTYTSVGYPMVPIPGFNFDGQKMWQCDGSTIAFPDATVSVKVDNLTNGSSGGPWFRFLGDQSLVSGIQSYSFVDRKVSFSPTFSAWVMDFYKYCFGNQ